LNLFDINSNKSSNFRVYCVQLVLHLTEYIYLLSSLNEKSNQVKMNKVALQCISQNKLHKSRRLNFIDCGLINCLPDELFDCVWLEEIIFTNISSKNNSKFKGDELIKLVRLKNLKTIGFDRVKILNYDFLTILTSIQELSLIRTGISDIDTISQCSQLTYLSVDGNNIQNISSIQKLINLNSLSIRSCRIEDYSPISKLIYLNHLSLENNEIENIDFIKPLLKLKYLYLDDNKIEDIDVFRNLKQLEHLGLRNNPIKTIDSLTNLTTIESLNLNDTLIEDFSCVSNLIEIERLQIGENFDRIKDYSFLKKLKKIKELDIGGNQIDDINFLRRYKKLEYLNLCSNNITNIDCLHDLFNLETLELYENQIEDIEQIKQLCNLPFLYSLTLNGNPLKLPPELNLDNISELRDYFLDVEKGASSKRNVKILFMGDGCSGKTTLYQHLKTEQPPPDIDINNRTHGISLETWTKDLPDVNVKVWDFGGQDIFHSTHRLFLGHRAIYVLVWTKQSNKKCTEGEQHPLRYWLDFIADYGKESSVLLVENIIDGRFDISEFPDDDSLDKLVKEYQEKSIRLDITHHRIDCKFDTRKVKSFKRVLQNEIQQIIEDYPIYDFPANWYDVQEELEKIRSKNKTITLSLYEDICKTYKISNAKALLPFFDRCGVICYMPNLFENIIILQTEWILEAMYSFLKLEDNQ
jgi:internalin A